MLVEVIEATLHSFDSGLEVLGELRPYASVDVMSRISGRLSQVLVERADAVKKGQLIAVVDDEDLRQRIASAEAAIAVSRAAVEREQVAFENLEIQARRVRTLHSDQLVSDQDLEDIEGRVRVAGAQLAFQKAQVDQAEASLSELKIQHEQTRIYAPLDGFVSQRFLDPGALVNAGIAILNVIDVKLLKTLVPVSESELQQIQLGLSAVVRVDAYPDRRYTGVVKRISPFLDRDTRSADVEIEIANPAGRLKPGMFARVVFDISSKATAVSVPRSALLTRGSGKGVYTLDEDLKTVFLPVTVGRIQGDTVEILQGLEVGTQVVTAGAQKLNDGDKVRLG